MLSSQNIFSTVFSEVLKRNAKTIRNKKTETHFRFHGATHSTSKEIYGPSSKYGIHAFHFEKLFSLLRLDLRAVNITICHQAPKKKNITPYRSNLASITSWRGKALCSMAHITKKNIPGINIENMYPNRSNIYVPMGGFSLSFFSSLEERRNSIPSDTGTMR